MKIVIHALAMLTMCAGLAYGAEEAKIYTAAHYPRPLTGRDLLDQYRSEEWETSAQHRDGYRTSAHFFPNGRVTAINVKGGGAVTGSWVVQEDKNQLCLRWDQSGWSSNGCYAAVQVGPNSLEFQDADSGKWQWRISFPEEFGPP